MGSKSEAPEAPDYSELAAASEKSAEYAYDIAQQQQDWAEKVYEDNKIVSDIVIEKALGALDQQEADAARDRERYETIFQPLEEQLAYEAQEYDSPERLEYEAGQAEADVAAQFEAARKTAQQNLEQYGVDPSQTRQSALDLGTRVAEAAAQAGAGNLARTAAEEYADQLRAQAIDVGRGYPGQVATSTAGASNSGTQAVNTGLATTSSGAETMGTGSSWQSLGNQAVSGWADILNTGFNNALDSWTAEQNASSGWGSALGLAGGLATAFFDEGGMPPRPGLAGPPARYVPPSASPSHGAIPDDVPAVIEGGQPARLDAGEFVIPEDVTRWVGEKGMQQFVLKARKEMTGANGERPAQPEQRPIPPDSVGAIPPPPGG